MVGLGFYCRLYLKGLYLKYSSPGLFISKSHSPQTYNHQFRRAPRCEGARADVRPMSGLCRISDGYLPDVVPSTFAIWVNNSNAPLKPYLIMVMYCYVYIKFVYHITALFSLLHECAFCIMYVYRTGFMR